MSKLNEYLHRINESYPLTPESQVRSMHNKMHKELPDDNKGTLSGPSDERVPAEVEKTAAVKLANKEDPDKVLAYVTSQALKYVKDPDEAEDIAQSILSKLTGK